MEEEDSAVEVADRYAPAIHEAVERALARAWVPLSPVDLERCCGALAAADPVSRQQWLYAKPEANHPDVVRALVRKSYALRGAEPAQALRLGQAALDAAEAMDLGPQSRALLADLRAQAWANVANCYRILDDFRAADRGFAQAEQLWRTGTGDPLISAQLLRKKGTLRQCQRRLGEAVSLFKRAARTAERADDGHLAAKARIQQAVAHFYADQLDRALDTLARAGKQLEAGREPEMGFALLHNQLFFLEASGDDMLTLLLSKRTQELYRVMSPLVQYRALWLRGRVLLRLGAPAGAYGFLDACRRGFLVHNLRYDAALCGFDTALALVRQHKFFEANRMVSDMAEVFRAQEIPHQAARALEALASTGIACKLTLHAVEALARELEPVRKPGFRPGAGP